MPNGVPIISPAIMAKEWDSLIEQIEAISEHTTHAQIDVMDGNLVPPISFPYNQTNLEGKVIPHSDKINFEVHLMVQNPKEVGANFIRAGATRITAQLEGFYEEEAMQTFEEWKDRGAETGVSLLLDTPLKDVVPLIDSGAVSLVQVMSIARVGYQGEKFDERALARIQELRELYPNVTIAVDGGVNSENLKSLFDAGANSFGIGSRIMKTENPPQALLHFQKLLNSFTHVT